MQAVTGLARRTSCAVGGSVVVSGVIRDGSRVVGVDNAIEGVTGPYPIIDTLPQRLTLEGSEIAAIDAGGAEERHERPSEDLDPTSVRQLNQLEIARLDLRGGDRRIARCEAAGVRLAAEADV